MVAPLLTRLLGRTGLRLTRIGFGAGPLGGFYGPVTPEDALAAVRAAWDGGVRYFDVAPLYGYGRSELLLGSALREYPREEFVLSTKVGRWFEPSGGDMAGLKEGGLRFRPVLDYSREGTFRALEQSMLRLGLDRLDAVFIHDVDSHSLGSEEAAEAAFAAAMAGAYPTLIELKRSGAIRAIGIGVNLVPWALRWIREADLDCVMIAGRYTLLNREAEADLFPECERRGVGVLAAGAFNGGVLARGREPGVRYNYRPPTEDVFDRVALLRERAHAAGVDLKAAAIQFVLEHPAVTSLVIGAMSAGEVRENLSGLGRPIDAGVLGELARLTA